MEQNMEKAMTIKKWAMPAQQLGDKAKYVGGNKNLAYDLRKSIALEMGFETVEKYATLGNEKVPEGSVDTLSRNFAKALTTTLSTYSAGTLPVLIPVYVDPEIVDATRRATPLVELIPRVTNYGRTADFNIVYKIATAQPLPEDGAFLDQDDKFDRVSLVMRYLYSKGRVTGPMFAASKQYLASGGYVDALSLDVKDKTLALKRLEESMLLLGDSVTNWTEPVNSTTVAAAYSYDGLWNLISNSNSNNTYSSTWYTAASHYSNVSASAVTKLGISTLRTAIMTCRTSGGEPNLMVCDYQTYDDIKALIQDQLRYVTTTTIAWGITTVSFEGIPIIASRFLSTTAASSATTWTPSTSKSLFVLDTNVIEMRVLQDVTYQELAPTNDSVPYYLKCYEVLVVKAPQFNYVLTGLG